MLKTSMLKQQGGFKKNHVFDHETWKSGLFPCYRLKINDFLSSYNQNLKIHIFTPLQQIPYYCKSRLGTLRLISWWRVTYYTDTTLAGCLVGLVAKMSASRVGVPGFDSRLCCGDFSGLSHTSDLKIGTPVATLPGTSRYRDITGTAWPGVSIL